jgi:hypothetical protein
LKVGTEYIFEETMVSALSKFERKRTVNPRYKKSQGTTSRIIIKIARQEHTIFNLLNVSDKKKIHINSIQ